MRRMEARRRNARALWLRFSQSRARRRHRLSHARVRSTIQRLGSMTKPLACLRRLTISTARLAIAVLNIGRGDQCMQHETKRVDQQMALLALDQLAAIEARRVDAEPPFSALLTLWLSITQAVGVISRPACSRHLMESASWIRFSVPSQLHRQK